MKIRIFLSIIVLVIITGCSATPVQVASLRIKGSDTMYHLTSILAQEYMEQHPGISVYVDGGGTTSGVRSLIKGEIDICTASRNLEPEEVKLLADNFGSIGISYLIAKDGLCIFLNNDNPVSNLTVEQLRGIFSCSINNWKDLNGSDMLIERINRTPSSGSYLYFKEHILEGSDYCENSSVGLTTEGVISLVRKNPAAVGYGGIAFKSGVKFAAINNVIPNEETIRNDRYPITRYLYFYTLNQPSGPLKDFIDWVLSPKGQNIIKENGFISLFEVKF